MLENVDGAASCHYTMKMIMPSSTRATLKSIFVCSCLHSINVFLQNAAGEQLLIFLNEIRKLFFPILNKKKFLSRLATLMMTRKGLLIGTVLELENEEGSIPIFS